MGAFLVFISCSAPLTVCGKLLKPLRVTFVPSIRAKDGVITPERLHTGRVNLGLTYRECGFVPEAYGAIHVPNPNDLIPVNENSFFVVFFNPH